MSVACCPGHTHNIQNLIRIPAQPALDHSLETRFPVPTRMFSCGCFRVASFFEVCLRQAFSSSWYKNETAVFPTINSYLNPGKNNRLNRKLLVLTFYSCTYELLPFLFQNRIGTKQCGLVQLILCLAVFLQVYLSSQTNGARVHLRI